MRNISLEHSKQADKSWGDLYYHILPELINKMELKKGIELGTAFGGHSESILEKTNIHKLYTIDAYTKFDDSTDNFYWDGIPYDQADYDNMYSFTVERLSKFGDRCMLLKGKTGSSYPQINTPLDFIFIDALHTYDGVLNDLERWYAEIRIGGLISGHDYNHPNFPGVTKAVDEFSGLKNCNIIECEGHIWYFIKK